jgi:hypothetical protein
LENPAVIDQPEKQTLGWREWMELPDLQLGHIKAKVDTGARSSALHAFDIEPSEVDGQAWVAFKVHPLQHSDELTVECLTPIKDYRRVTDSGGHRTMRYVVETRVRMGTVLHTIELSLVDRSDMLFRMLLGRTAMRGRYIVDPARSYCLGKPDFVQQQERNRHSR